MIVVDSSIWIDHFRSANPLLIEAITNQQVLQHPFVTIELALGSIPRRQVTISDLSSLPQAAIVDSVKLLEFIDSHSLHGSGIGSIDANLLASTLLAKGSRLWSRDKRLTAQADRLDCLFKP